MVKGVFIICNLNMHDYISGIQQIGIGVKDASQLLNEYARRFGMNTLVFDDVSEAKLMTKYTGGEVYKRQALLLLNMKELFNHFLFCSFGFLLCLLIG